MHYNPETLCHVYSLDPCLQNLVRPLLIVLKIRRFLSSNFSNTSYSLEMYLREFVSSVCGPVSHSVNVDSELDFSLRFDDEGEVKESTFAGDEKGFLLLEP